jgi:glycerol-3-phosphate acyltransferase PlsX
MRIALDAMGGDFAPKAPVLGAIEALGLLPPEDEILLVGLTHEVQRVITAAGFQSPRLHIVDAPEVIGMDEAPTVALSHKRQASIPKGYQLLKQGDADAFIGAGNTGAMLVGAVYTLHTIPGIIRPCIPALIPRSSGGFSLILDVGSNPDAKPDVLYQYAVIGSLYARMVMGIPSPKVALLNIGEEEEKGNLLTQATHRLMKGSPDFNFTGNIEAREIFSDKADVIVCDGFTGNIVLKQTEGFYDMLREHKVTDPFFDQFNYELYGGTPILGVNGIAMIAHGISGPAAFRNMFAEIRKIYLSGLVKEMQNSLKRFID